MQKTKKQLLGFAGLAAVGVMTAVACALPAAAAEDVPPSAGGNTEVTITVRSGVNNVSITSPADASVVTDPNVAVTYSYEETTNVKTYVEYKDSSNKIVRELVDNFTPTDSQVYGTRTINLDVTKYSAKEKDYKVIVVATDQYGGSKEDTITFSYRAMTAEVEEKPSSNGDPITNIRVNGEVQQILVSVYDKNGKPLFVNKDGKEVPLVLTRDDIDPVTGAITTILPFAEYNANDGQYTIVVSAYDGKSEDGAALISMITLAADYALIKPVDPNLPETPPNTGFAIGDLNISRVDYLITGLIVFGTVAGFALYLVYRKSRR